MVVYCEVCNSFKFGAKITELLGGGHIYRDNKVSLRFFGERGHKILFLAKRHKSFGYLIGAENTCIFAHKTQYARHCHCRAESISVGMNVANEQKAIAVFKTGAKLV